MGYDFNFECFMWDHSTDQHAKVVLPWSVISGQLFVPPVPLDWPVFEVPSPRVLDRTFNDQRCSRLGTFPTCVSKMRNQIAFLLCA